MARVNYFRGTYVPADDVATAPSGTDNRYRERNEVIFEGNLYIAAQNFPAETPGTGTNWTLKGPTSQFALTTEQLAVVNANPFTNDDVSKLDGIEADATADQTAAEIRALVEAADNSNVFTDADNTKLDGIEAGATGDQTNAEIRAAVEAATNSNVFTDADHTKLDGIAAGADVTPSWVPDSDPSYLTAIPADVIRDADFGPATGDITTINIAGTTRNIGGGTGGGGVTVQDEGTALSTTATTLNFAGDGVTASGTGATKTITIPGGSGASADGSSIINTNNVISVSPEIITNAAVGAHTAERLQPAHTVDNSYQLFNGFTDNGSLPDDLQGVASTFIRPAVEYTRGSRTMIVWFADTTIANAGITTGTELSFLFTGLTSGFRVTGEVVEVDNAERTDETKVGVQFPASSPAIEILEQGTVIPHQRLPGDRIVYGISLFQSEFVDMRSDWTVNYLASNGTLAITLPITETESALAHTRYRLVTSGGTFVFDGSDVTESGVGRTWTVTRFSTNSATANIVGLASQTLEIGVAEAHQITETTYRAVGYDENNQLQGQEYIELDQFRPSELDRLINRPNITIGNSSYGTATRFNLVFNGFPQFTYTINSGTLRFADVTGDTDDITDDTTGFFGIANNAEIGEVLQFGLVGSSGSAPNTVNRREIYTVLKAGDNRYTVTVIQDFDTLEETDVTQGVTDVPTTTVASGFAAELRLLTTPRYRRAENYSRGDGVSSLDDDGLTRLYVSQQSNNLGNLPGFRNPISVTNISVNANQGNRIEITLPQNDRFFDIPTEIYNFAWTNTVGGVATRYSGSILGADIDIGISNQTETLHFEYDATFVTDDLSNLNDKPFPFDLAPTSGTNSDFSLTDSGQHFWAAAGSFGTRQIQEVRAIADSRIARISPLTLRGLGVERVGTDTFALATSIGGTTLSGVTITDDTNPPRVSFTLTETATTAFETELTARGSFNGNPFYILFGTNTDNAALVTFRAENHNFGTQAIISANQTPEFTRWLETLPDSAFTSSARTTLRYDAFGGVISVATADFGGRVRADVDEDGHPILTVDHNPLVNNVVASQTDWDEIASHITYDDSTDTISAGITDGAAYDFRVNPVVHTTGAVAAQFSDVWRGGTPNAYLYLGSRRNIPAIGTAGRVLFDVLSYFGGGYRHFDRTGLINATGEQGRAANPAIVDNNGTAQVQLVNLTGGPITIGIQGGGTETFQSGEVVSNVRTLVRATGLNQAGTAFSTDSASRAIIEIQGIWRSAATNAAFDQDNIGTHRGLRFQIQTRPGVSAVTDRLFGGSSETANVPQSLSTFDATTGLFRHGSGGGGSSSFIGLSDTPSALGTNGQVLGVQQSSTQLFSDTWQWFAGAAGLFNNFAVFNGGDIYLDGSPDGDTAVTFPTLADFGTPLMGDTVAITPTGGTTFTTTLDADATTSTLNSRFGIRLSLTDTPPAIANNTVTTIVVSRVGASQLAFIDGGGGGGGGSLTTASDLSSITPTTGMQVLYTGPAFAYLDTAGQISAATNSGNTNSDTLEIGNLFIDTIHDARNTPGSVSVAFQERTNATFSSTTRRFTGGTLQPTRRFATTEVDDGTNQLRSYEVTTPSTNFYAARRLVNADTNDNNRISLDQSQKFFGFGQLLAFAGQTSGVPTGTCHAHTIVAGAVTGAGAAFFFTDVPTVNGTRPAQGTAVLIPTEVVRPGVIFFDGTKWR